MALGRVRRPWPDAALPGAGLVDAAALTAWRERARAPGTLDSYLDVRTLAGYYLVAQDAHGPYLTGHRWLFMFDPRPSQPPKLVYRNLVRGARWLGPALSRTWPRAGTGARSRLEPSGARRLLPERLRPSAVPSPLRGLPGFDPAR